MSDYLRPESYPLLPDYEASADEFVPHPDGRPWRKACIECAFRTNDPQGLGGSYQQRVREGSEGTTFYCLHRDDDDCQRICASWAAVREGEARRRS